MLVLILNPKIVQAQSFPLPIAPPNIQEDVFNLPPNANIWDSNCQHPSHSNANSYGNLTVTTPNTDTFDLYVSTWDPSIGVSFGDPGFLVRQYHHNSKIKFASISQSHLTAQDFVNAMTPTNSWLYPGVRSLEAGILKKQDSIFIILTYYLKYGNSNTVNSNFFMDIYLWHPDSTATIHLQPYMRYKFINADWVAPAWIHQDVNSHNKIVMTWRYGKGFIYTEALRLTPNGLKMGGIGVLNIPFKAMKPDVAMLKQTNGNIDLYYSFTSWDSSTLYVYKSDYNTLYNLVSPQALTWSYYYFQPPTLSPNPLFSIAIPFNVQLLYEKEFDGKLGLPRIDAPDNSPGNIDDSRIWATVVKNHLPDRDEILAVTGSSIPGDIFAENILNDGSLIPNGDLTPTFGNLENYSARPEVAFSHNGLDLSFAWVYKNPDVLETFPTIQNPDAIGDGAVYLSLKTTFDLTLLNGYSPYQYYKVAAASQPLDPDLQKYYAACSPSIALSTQNDASPYLYTSFLLMNKIIGNQYSIGLKTTEWNSLVGFRGISGVSNIEEKKSFLTVYPNPFSQSFSLHLKVNNNQSYTFSLINLLGQSIYTDKDTIKEINDNLQDKGKSIPAGSYFIELTGKDGTTYRHKLIKH